jgi:hypothetical protein
MYNPMTYTPFYRAVQDWVDTENQEHLLTALENLQLIIENFETKHFRHLPS